MASFWQNFLIAGRLLKRDSLSTLSILLSLTLGIGLHAASIILFLSLCRSPVTGVEDPRNLVLITGGERLGGGGWLPISFPDYHDLAETSHRLSGIAAFQAIRPTLIVSEVGDAQPTGGEAVTPNLFTALGIKPLLGRLLLPDDDKPGTSGAVVLSYQMWTNRFGQDPRIIGRKIRVGGQPCTVVGVLRSEFIKQSNKAADKYLPQKGEYFHETFCSTRGRNAENDRSNVPMRLLSLRPDLLVVTGVHTCRI